MSGFSSRHVLAALPLVVLLAAAATFGLNVMKGAPKRASALIGRPAPVLNLPSVPGTNVPGLSPGDLGGVTVINFWASWCPPCKIEHPVLLELSGREDLTLVGVDWKDVPETAHAYLEHWGNPFARIGADMDGRAGIEWGIGGVPETFVVGPDGRVLAHHEGPLTDDALRRLGIAGGD